MRFEACRLFRNANTHTTHTHSERERKSFYTNNVPLYVLTVTSYFIK